MKEEELQLLEEANKLQLTHLFKYVGVRRSHWGYQVWFVESHSLGGTIDYQLNNDKECVSISISLQTIPLKVVNELFDIVVDKLNSGKWELLGTQEI